MNIWILLGGLNAAFAVAADAHGWHELGSTPDIRDIFMMGSRYQMWHAFGLFAAGLMYAKTGLKSFAIAGGLFQAGIVLFSGTLYSFGQFMVVPVTGAAPVGGGLMILGWLVLGIVGAKQFKAA